MEPDLVLQPGATLADREAERTPPGVAKLTSAAFGALSRIRGSRIVHPKGSAFEATLQPTTHAPLGVDLFDRGEPLPAVVRLSRAVGLPAMMPDPCGVALRVPDAYGSGLHQDLLLVSSGSSPVLRHALFPRKRFEGGFYSSLLPFNFGGKTRMIGAAASRAESGSALWFQLKLATAVGLWRTIARVDLGARLPADEAERICFNPWNTGGGIEPAGFINALRSPAYRGSQAGRFASG